MLIDTKKNRITFLSLKGESKHSFFDLAYFLLRDFVLSVGMAVILLS